MKKIKEEAEKAKKNAEDIENKYHEVTGQLDLVKLDLDDALQKNQRLEKQLKVAQAANLAHIGSPLAKQPSNKRILHQNRVSKTRY